MEGDFIVKLNFYSTTPVIPDFGRAIVFDIIRFDEDGRATEHWDIAEEIADPEQIDDLFQAPNRTRKTRQGISAARVQPCQKHSGRRAAPVSPLLGAGRQADLAQRRRLR